ncbi:type VII secretion-associated serine protease mycosin [Catenuloplanes sp. NPDC051500]|uniref:type VII secretion-associated serine protease mycosin n=1 Tax=Catenuloplanes sp. NPDC051500 TaxID=3363959 RepID=UPI0037908D38
MRALLAGALLAVPPPASAAAPQCQEPGQVIAPVPWPQRALLPQRAYPLATGAGITVAVLDSGVDAAHPQLAGQVLGGRDYLYSAGGRGDRDCVGHGTAVGSIIAARAVDGAGFRGIAPGARLLPVIVSERRSDGEESSGEAVSPARFATAVRDAVAAGAGIINISAVFTADDPAVRAAVEFATGANVLVVAAAGNSATDGNPTPYPAAYPDVLGVGAVDESGRVLDESGRGDFVDLVAPGDGVVAATRQRGHAVLRGTSFATAFVSGAAALVRQYHPDLDARAVARRLIATASPSPGGPRSDAYGAGAVDPYRAVTERLVAADPTAAAAPLVPRVDPAAVARAREWQRLTVTALRLCAGLLGVALAGALIVVARRRGRWRRWRPARAAPAREPTLAPLGPPVGLLDDLSPGDHEAYSASRFSPQ